MAVDLSAFRVVSADGVTVVSAAPSAHRALTLARQEAARTRAPCFLRRRDGEVAFTVAPDGAVMEHRAMTRRSKVSLERRMTKNQKPHRFGEIVDAVPVDGCLPERLRYSSLAGRLPPELRAEFEADRAKAAHCPNHGPIADPVVFMVGEGAGRRVAFACPWCSGPDVLAAWEREGAS